MFYNLNQVCVSFSSCWWRRSIYRGKGGGAGVMWSDAAPPASPSGRCRWACRRWAWRRRDAPDTWGRWSAERAGAAATWRTWQKKCHRFDPPLYHDHNSWNSFLTFLPTCPAGRGICVSCTTPTMRKPFPSAPRPLGGLTDLSHLSTQSGQLYVALLHRHTGDGCLCRWPTWVEEDDGAQTAELCLVHLHVFHLGHQLRQDSADMNVVLGVDMETKRRP